MKERNLKRLSADQDALIDLLIQLGLEYYEALIYVHVVKRGYSTAWDLSKTLNIPRTNIYRYANKLIQKGFIVENIEGKSIKYNPLIKTKLDELLLQKESELKFIKENYNFLVTELEGIAVSGRTNYKIFHYKGLEGIKQVTWNSTKAKDTFRIFEIDLLSSITDIKFAEKMRYEFAKMPIEFHQLTNNTVFNDYTKVTGHVKQWRVKHIPKDLLDIKIETQIYNDVVCMYDYTVDDVFIVEIYNQKLADMYKQMFDHYWSIAQNMKIVSPYGAAILD